MTIPYSAMDILECVTERHPLPAMEEAQARVYDHFEAAIKKARRCFLFSYYKKLGIPFETLAKNPEGAAIKCLVYMDQPDSNRVFVLPPNGHSTEEWQHTHWVQIRDEPGESQHVARLKYRVRYGDGSTKVVDAFDLKPPKNNLEKRYTVDGDSITSFEEVYEGKSVWIRVRTHFIRLLII